RLSQVVFARDRERPLDQGERLVIAPGAIEEQAFRDPRLREDVMQLECLGELERLLHPLSGGLGLHEEVVESGELRGDDCELARRRLWLSEHRLKPAASLDQLVTGIPGAAEGGG